MDTNNRNNPEFNNMYENMYDIDNMNNEENIYSINRYDNRRNENNIRYDFDRRFNSDRRYDNDRRYDGRYYQYPYCDRYGRCGNPIWWLFWPFFFF